MPDTTSTTGPVTAAGGLPRPPLYPALFQLNTLVRLRALGDALDRPAALDGIPDAELDHIAAQGFDWVYCLGVWSTGEAGQRIPRSNPEWRHEFHVLPPHLEEHDNCGSRFAVTDYV